MADPLNGAIIHALDPSDFVCLILENIVPAAAGWHGEMLALLTRGWTRAQPSQMGHRVPPVRRK